MPIRMASFEKLKAKHPELGDPTTLMRTQADIVDYLVTLAGEGLHRCRRPQAARGARHAAYRRAIRIGTPIVAPKIIALSHRNDFNGLGASWQEWRDSNPQPPVLETGALAN